MLVDATREEDSAVVLTPSESLAKSYNVARAARAARCGYEPGLYYLTEVLRTSYVSELLPSTLDAGGVNDGVRSAVLACAESMGSAACGSRTEKCMAADAVTGALPRASTCQTSVQCASGLCSSSRISCCKCEPTVRADGDCKDTTAVCAPGNHCLRLPSPFPTLCRSYVMKPVGSDCDDALAFCSPGATCTDKSDDASGKICKQVVPVSGACGAEGKGTCDNGATVRCSDRGICTDTFLGGPGSSCTSFQTGDCRVGLVCDEATKQCRLPEDRKLGVACTYAEVDGDRCAPGSHCELASEGAHACLADLTLGASCEGDARGSCGNTATCDFGAGATNQCARRVYPADCK